MINERTGLPLSIGICAAMTHGSQGLEALVQGIPPIAPGAGPADRRPAELHGDKGYDYDDPREWPRSRNITPRLARRGIESSQKLGRHRWTVERTAAWLSGCRRLHQRYERRAEHFLAFAGIAATLIPCRRLGG
ncbi:transposase [Streptomyces kanasensis]|uniref:Transposase n=1 Tax=Streptomyces kanasensis TaxID=936756 RepID=A0A100YAW3_9ACTN|nr:transposase [Streptomyces kanasensis]